MPIRRRPRFPDLPDDPHLEGTRDLAEMVAERALKDWPGDQADLEAARVTLKTLVLEDRHQQMKPLEEFGAKHDLDPAARKELMSPNIRWFIGTHYSPKVASMILAALDEPIHHSSGYASRALAERIEERFQVSGRDISPGAIRSALNVLALAGAIKVLGKQKKRFFIARATDAMVPGWVDAYRKNGHGSEDEPEAIDPITDTTTCEGFSAEADDSRTGVEVDDSEIRVAVDPSETFVAGPGTWTYIEGWYPYTPEEIRTALALLQQCVAAEARSQSLARDLGSSRAEIASLNDRLTRALDANDTLRKRVDTLATEVEDLTNQRRQRPPAGNGQAPAYPLAEHLDDKSRATLDSMMAKAKKEASS